MTPHPPLPTATPRQGIDHAASVRGSVNSIMPTSPLGTAVVTVLGEIDYRATPALSSRLHHAIENCAAVVLDLTAVTPFDHAGLQILNCAADHARTLAVTFTVMWPEPSASSGHGTAVLSGLRSLSPSTSPSTRSVSTGTGTSWT